MTGCVACRRRACPRPRWLCVASGTSSRIRSTSTLVEAGLEQPLGRAAAHEPLRARAGVDPGRLDADDAGARARAEAAAIPISETISCVGRPVTGVSPLERVARGDPHLGAQRAAGARRCARAMCSASSSTSNASPITTSSIASSNSSGKRDMWTPFWAGSRSTVQSISAEISFSLPPAAEPDRLARRRGRPRARGRAAPRAARPGGRVRGAAWLRPSPQTYQGRSWPKTHSFARLVSLACHDLRTPLATVRGFAHTLARSERLDEPTAALRRDDRRRRRRSSPSCSTSSRLAARIEGGRYEPNAASGRHARAGAGRGRAARRRARASSRATGPWSSSTPRRPSAAVARARPAARSGTAASSEVELAVDGPELAISPSRPPRRRSLLGEDLRDLGAAVAVRVVQALGGSVAVDGETLTIRLT